MFCFPYQHFTLTVILILKSLVTGHGQLTKHVHVDQESNRYYKSFMQLDTIGVSQCIKMCKRYKLCKKIHHNREQLTCDLMMTFAEKGNMTSLLDVPPSQEDTTNCGNCSESDICIETKEGRHICLEQDVCPVHWVPFNHKCYFFSSELTADDNTMLCAGKGAKMVRIDNDDVTSFLISEIRKRVLSVIWISANDHVLEDEWMWGPGDKVMNPNWANGAPNNNGNEDCAVMNQQGTWHDKNCENGNYGYGVCEDHYKTKP
ncbi:CD209 antigen-like protein A [Argopecten irradians]|uniref:CD209 antigen-like protein A n=1 Tax=Argopecten irradians TaxID=31199 RepID=UPI003724210C